MTVNASVELRREGGLFLMDSNGSLVWSTQTNGSPVYGLNLTENGNLVIFGHNNQSVWQSVDHPPDGIQPVQIISSAKELRRSTASNFEQG